MSLCLKLIHGTKIIPMPTKCFWQTRLFLTCEVHIGHHRWKWLEVVILSFCQSFQVWVNCYWFEHFFINSRLWNKDRWMRRTGHERIWPVIKKLCGSMWGHWKLLQFHLFSWDKKTLQPRSLPNRQTGLWTDFNKTVDDSPYLY